MKETYEKPEVEVVEFDNDDIVTVNMLSGNETGGGSGDPTTGGGSGF